MKNYFSGNFNVIPFNKVEQVRMKRDANDKLIGVSVGVGGAQTNALLSDEDAARFLVEYKTWLDATNPLNASRRRMYLGMMNAYISPLKEDSPTPPPSNPLTPEGVQE